MIVRVLIVENSTGERKLMRLQFDCFSDEDKRRLGIERFDLYEAASSGSAVTSLKAASKENKPYDLVLLDLSLPETDAELREKPAHGLSVLRFARKHHSAKAILVVSAYSYYPYVRSSMKGGAVDFIAKPLDPLQQVLHHRVLACLDWVLQRETERILALRARELLPYAHKALVQCFGTWLSEFVGSVAQSTQGIAVLLQDRFNIDVFGADASAVGGYFASLEDATRRARLEWKDLQKSIQVADNPPTCVELGELLRSIVEELSPCLITKRIQVKYRQGDRTKVVSFGNDVQTVLKEIILCATVDILKSNIICDSTITVTIRATKDGVRISLVDNLKPLREEEVETINHASGLLAGENLGRAWGLSVAQLIARRGGGQLTIKTKKRGNIITYQVPAGGSVHAKDSVN